MSQEDASQLTTSLAMSRVTRAGVLAQIDSLESWLKQHRAGSTQELSNLGNTHALSLAEKQIRIPGPESSLTAIEASITAISSIEDERNALRINISSLQRALEESSGAVRRLEISNESAKRNKSTRWELDALHV